MITTTKYPTNHWLQLELHAKEILNDGMKAHHIDKIRQNADEYLAKQIIKDNQFILEIHLYGNEKNNYEFLLVLDVHIFHSSILSKVLGLKTNHPVVDQPALNPLVGNDAGQAVEIRPTPPTPPAPRILISDTPFEIINPTYGLLMSKITIGGGLGTPAKSNPTPTKA
ncbi:MAG: hypothetical protein M3N30_11360 [Bacteroidota bacterium]|nr:hypothetical protein [Bacteroidota bacterium]